tara:strand:- start:6927 stop:7985 length:1059 start_codon:yes stop_codon:yes gene_type:complete
MKPTKIHPEEEHAKYSPSSLNYRAACNAFENRGGTSPAAEEGTLMHAALEKRSFDALNPEQLALVNKCLAFMAPLELTAREAHPEIRLEIELSKKHTTWGTADQVFIVNDRAHMVDFKFGRLAVLPADQNLQAMAYVIGVFQRFPAVNTVEAHFLLPRRDEVTSHTFERSLLVSYCKALSKLFDKFTAKKRVATPCKACEYCASLGSCLAVAKRINAAVNPTALFEEEDTVPSLMTTRALNDCGLPLARLAAAWADTVKDLATAKLRDGETMEDHKLSSRKSSAKITVPTTDVWDGVASKFISQDAFLACCTASIPKLRKAVGKANVEELNEQLVKEGCVTEGDPVTFISRK